MKHKNICKVMSWLLALSPTLIMSSTSSMTTRSLICGRASDQISIVLSDRAVAYFEVISVRTMIREENRAAGVRNIATFAVYPIIVSDEAGDNLLFRTLEPVVAVSSGKVRSVRYFTREHGYVDSATMMTMNGLFRVEVEFASEIPREFIVIVTMSHVRDHSKSRPDLVCRISDDDIGFLFDAKPVSRLRVIDAEGSTFSVYDGSAKVLNDSDGWAIVEPNKHFRIRSERAGKQGEALGFGVGERR